MISLIFAGAKNILTIAISLGVILSYTSAADKEEKIPSPLLFSTLQKQSEVPDESSPPVSPRHRYQYISFDESSTSYQWAMRHETPKKFRASLNSDLLASKIDFSDEIPCIRRQGDLGTCTAMTMVTSLEYYYTKIKEQPINFSPLFVYYNERRLTSTIEVDIGASLTDAIQAITIFGACQEATWPYIDDKIKFKEEPSKEAYREPRQLFQGMKFKHTKLSDDIALIKHFLSQKIPVQCGINVFPSLEEETTEKTGIIPMPGELEIPIAAHAITLVGYDDATERLKFANSWGVKWGDKGYGYLPYDYFTNNNLNNRFPHTYSNEVWCFKLVLA